MIDKKQIFQIVYAVALIGAIIACIGFLASMMELGQLRDVRIVNLGTLDDEFDPMFQNYRNALICGAVAVAVTLFNVFFGKKLGRWMGLVNCVVLLVAIVVFFILTLNVQSEFVIEREENTFPEFDSLAFSLVSAFRTAAMSMVAYLTVLFGCNVIDVICYKKEKVQADTENE
jgi:hypothetical protein